MKLFSTSLRILWQPGRRKQLCKKKQFLLMCYTTTLHCFQILTCPKESITESGKWLIRQQKDKILQRFFKASLYYQKSGKHIEILKTCSSLPRPRKEKHRFQSGWVYQSKCHHCQGFGTHSTYLFRGLQQKMLGCHLFLYLLQRKKFDCGETQTP